MDVPFIGWQRVPTTTLAEAVGTLPIRGIGRYAACALQYARDHLQGCGGDDPYGLTIDEIAALNLYTKHNFRHPSHSFYSVLNRTLCLQDRQQLLPFFPYLKLFFTAARKLPNACPAKLWRGVAKGPKDVAAVHAKGKLIYWWGVTSTTYDADVLRSPQFFGSSGDRTLFMLECHAGVDISCYSDYDKAEVLLMPGTKLIVEQVMPGVMGGATLVLLKQLISSHDILKPQHPGGEDEDDAACGEEEAEEEDEKNDEDEVGQSERPTKRKAPDTAAQDDAAAGEGQEEEEADEEEHDNGGPPAKKQRTSCEGIAFLLAAVLYRIDVLSPGPALAVCYAVTNQCYAFTRTHTCTSTH